MNAKQRKTLNAIFTDPTPKTIEWQSVENLLISLGAELIEGSGSRVKFHRNGIIASFHRPILRKKQSHIKLKMFAIFLNNFELSHECNEL